MSGVIEKFDKLEQAAKLHLKGFTFAEIARELDIHVSTVREYVSEYKSWIVTRAENDPDLLDRLTENTMQALDEINLVLSEAWRAHEQAKEWEAMNHQLSALKLIKEINDSKAKLLQLAGARQDGGNMAHLKRVEQVNQIVSEIIKEIIKDCPRCRQEAQVKLAEAFDLMGKQDDITDAELVDA